MIPAINTAKIFSTLGNNNSLVPLAIKDIANSLGITAGSYITGDKFEGKDRFLDEFGTQAIWLFGIPAYKKAIDFTAYKVAGLSPKVDVRVLKDKNILQKALDFAPTKTIQKQIEKVMQNQKTFKGLTIAKFAASTLLTVASYWGLTKFRHKNTKEQIKKELLKNTKPETNKFLHTGSTPLAFSAVKKTKVPTFTGGGLQDFVFNPVKNLMIVDGSITGERLMHARNPQDFLGYVVKEGGFWFFMYFAGSKIQKAVEKAAKKKFNKSIDLDARVLERPSFMAAFKNKSVEKSLKDFPAKGTDAEIYEYIIKNQNNEIVKAAKRSDVISLKNSKKIDTRKFIDIQEIKDLHEKISKLYGEFSASSDSAEKFFKQIKGLKRKAVLKNIGACIGALGIVVPAVMVALRFLKKDNKEFQVKKEIEQEIASMK